MVRLIEHVGPDRFQTFHMEGHWDASGEARTDAIARALGDPAVPVAPLPWWLMHLASLFLTTPREMMEMRYLWRHPSRLDNARLLSALGFEPHTPLAAAVHATLASMNCLDHARVSGGD